MASIIRKVSGPSEPLIVKVTAGGAVSPGDIINSCPGGRPIGVYIGAEAKAAGDLVPYEVAGEFEMPVASALDVSAGDSLFWDVADGELNDDETNNIYAGQALNDAGTGVTKVRVFINEGPADVAGA